MLRVVMFDLGLTLVDGDRRPFPHVVTALTTLAGFRTVNGRPLASCLVSDYTMPDPARSSSKVVQELVRAYLQELEATGLRTFFEPVRRRVTLSTQAGVRKPDRAIFELAVRRLRSTAGISECMLITENADHVAAVRELGMLALQYRSHDPGDFADWSRAPLLVAHAIAPEMTDNLKLALRGFIAAAHDLEVDTVAEAPDARHVAVSARGWRRLDDPRLGQLDGVWVELPVRGTVALDARGDVHEVDLESPLREELDDAAAFVMSLTRRGEIASSPAERRGTHHVEIDDAGRRRVVRTGFQAR